MLTWVSRASAARALVLAALVMCGGAIAQSGPRFAVQRFDVQGNTLLSASEMDEALAPYRGGDKTFADLRKAAEALEAAYLAHGFGGVQVLIPEQDVSAGVVRLRVAERRVGKVTVEGNQAFGAENVRRSVPWVREREVPNLDAIARNLQLLAEHPSKRTEVLLRSGAAEDVVDVGIRVSDEKPWKTFLSLDNTGTASTGYYRLGVGYQHSNLFDRDHVLTAQYVTSPTYASKVSIYGLGYRVPFYESHSSLDLMLGYSNVNSGTVAGLFTVSGQGTIASARWNWYPARWGEVEQKVSLGLDYKAFSNQVMFQEQGVVPDITVHPASATYAGVRRGADSELSFYGSLSANLPGGNDGTQADFDRSRAGASARYTIVRYGASYLRQLGTDWQVRAAVNGQETGDALVSGEQFGLGGPDSVRGYLPREVVNDRGYSVQIELYTPELASRLGLAERQQLRLLAFLDGGSVWRNHALPGEATHDSIGSAGVGARWNYGKSASLKLDLAQVLQATPDRRRNSQRLGAALALSF